MPLTRILIETKLVARTKAWLQLAGMNVSVYGANNDLDDAIDSALRDTGFGGSATGIPADVDLVNVLPAQLGMLVDIAQLRLLESIDGNVTTERLSLGPLSQHYKLLRPQIDALRLQINSRYGGILFGEIGTGVIVLTTRSTDSDGNP
jgi:hypothetical protein